MFPTLKAFIFPRSEKPFGALRKKRPDARALPSSGFRPAIFSGPADKKKVFSSGEGSGRLLARGGAGGGRNRALARAIRF